MAIRRIGQILVDLGFINDEQLEMLLEEQRRHPGELLGKIAEEMGLVTDDQVALALAEQMHMQVVRLSEAEVQPEVLELITEPMAQLYRVIPIELDDNVFTLATCDPQNLAIQDELRTFLGLRHQVAGGHGTRDRRGTRTLLREFGGNLREPRGRPGRRQRTGTRRRVVDEWRRDRHHRRRSAGRTVRRFVNC